MTTPQPTPRRGSQKCQNMRMYGRRQTSVNRRIFALPALGDIFIQFKRHCRRVGLSTSDKLTLRCLRKSYAQNHADIGGPPRTLKDLLGHASIQTTERFYLRRSDANELRACAALDKLMAENKTDARMTPGGLLGGLTDQGEECKSSVQNELRNGRYGT